MEIKITSNDGVPIYRQIGNQVKYLVASGRLAPGEKIPSIRALAEKLVLNRNTVTRAYSELEYAGILTKRRGAGTYVSETGSILRQRERVKILVQRTDALLVEAGYLDIDLENVISLVQDRHELIHSQALK